eukprot:gene28854-27640_t
MIQPPACSLCANDAGGSCYPALALTSYKWQPSDTSGWSAVYDKGATLQLLGPPNRFAASSFSRKG